MDLLTPSGERLSPHVEMWLLAMQVANGPRTPFYVLSTAQLWQRRALQVVSCPCYFVLACSLCILHATLNLGLAVAGAHSLHPDKDVMTLSAVAACVSNCLYVLGRCSMYSGMLSQFMCLLGLSCLSQPA